MTNYLEASCVFNALVALDLIVMTQWKHENTRELYYPVHFLYKGRRAIASFEVYIIKGQHCVRKSNLEVIAHRHNFDMSDISGKCIL
jgi:hypothetical protein